MGSVQLRIIPRRSQVARERPYRLPIALSRMWPHSLRDAQSRTCRESTSSLAIASASRRARPGSVRRQLARRWKRAGRRPETARFPAERVAPSVDGCGTVTRRRFRARSPAPSRLPSRPELCPASRGQSASRRPSRSAGSKPSSLEHRAALSSVVRSFR